MIALLAAPEVFYALMALLAALGGTVLASWLTRGFRNISFLGIHPFSALGGWLASALDAAAGAFQQAATPVLAWLLAAPTAITGLVGQVIDTLAQLRDGMVEASQQIWGELVALDHVGTRYAQALQQWTANEIRRVAGTEAADVASLTNLIASTGEAALTQAETYAGIAAHDAVLHAEDWAANELYNLRSTIEGEIAAGVAAAEGTAQSLVSAAEGRSAALIAQAEADISNAYQAALADAQTLAGQAEAGAIATVEGDLAAPLAAVTALAASLAVEVDDCLKPNCNALKGLGSLFAGLENLALDAALIALLVEASTNPRGAATAIEDTFGAVIHGTKDAITTMLDDAGAHL